MAFLVINGFHTNGSGGRYDGIGDHMERLDAAGIPFLGYCVEGTTGISDGQRIMRTSDVPHNLIFRRLKNDHTQSGDDVPLYHLTPLEAAQLHWDSHLKQWPKDQDRSLVWGETINEVRTEIRWADWIGMFCYHTARFALDAGMRWCGPGYASGCPDEGSWATPGMVEFLKLCSQYPDQIGVALHEYSYEVDDIKAEFGNRIGRFQLLLATTRRLGLNDPTIFFTEWGWTYRNIPSPEKAMVDILTVGQLYALYPSIRGAAVWALEYGWNDLAAQTHRLMEPLELALMETRYPDAPGRPDPPPPANLIENHSFENGWRDLPPAEGSLINQQPHRWKASWSGVGEEVREFTVSGVPEMVHKMAGQLPPDERPGGENELILDGTHVYKIFSGGAKWAARLSQALVGLKPGTLARATVPINIHKHDRPSDYDERDIRLEVRVNEGATELWTSDIPHREWQWITAEAVVPLSGVVELEITIEVKWEHPTDLFIDEVEMTIIKDVETPVEFPIPAEREDMPLVVDLSKWTGRETSPNVYAADTMDIPKMVQEGETRGFIIRATSGATEDPLYFSWLEQVQAVGVPFGNFHWLQPGTNAAVQAEKFVATRVPGKLHDWLDVERNGTVVPTADQVLLFDRRYKELTGELPGIYTNLDTWRNFIRLTGPDFAKRPLWIASFEREYGSMTRPVVPLPWDKDEWGETNAHIRYWQFGAYSMAGASKKVDHNVFHGSEVEFEELYGADPEGEIDPGWPRIDYPRTTIIVPQESTFERWMEICAMAFKKKRGVGFSPDDGGIGRLSSKDVIMVDIEPPMKPVFIQWYDTIYPGTNVSWLDGPVDGDPLQGLVFEGFLFTRDYALTAAFGEQRSGGTLHEGADYDVLDASGQKPLVLCAYPGVVARVRVEDPDYGTFVTVRHEYNGVFFFTWYCHLDSSIVYPGANIDAGEPVGVLGETGTQGVHLHLNLELEDGGGKGFMDPNVRFQRHTEEVGVVIEVDKAPEVEALLGLHAGADGGDITDDELGEFAELGAGVVKVMSSHSANSVRKLRLTLPNAVFIIRAFLDFGGRRVTPEDFVSWTLSDVRRAVGQLDGADVWVELHNEPNLVAEGLGDSWSSGVSFGVWYQDVLARYRAAMPGMKFLFPGLSPGAGVTGVKDDSLDFAFKAREAVNASDGLAIHAYWAGQNGWPMDKTFEQMEAALRPFPHMKVWVSESSNNKTMDHAQDKAAEYVAFWRGLAQFAQIRGVTYFVASASNPAWGWPSGSCETWEPVGMAARVRDIITNQ